MLFDRYRAKVFRKAYGWVGSVANTHGPDGRWIFGAGAVLASILWFAGVGFGVRLLGPLFSSPGKR